MLRNDVAMPALTPTRNSQLIPLGATQIQVELAHMPTRQLSQVSIGRSFVFGVLEDNSTWCLIRMSSIRSLTYLHNQPQSGTQVHFTRKAAGELLSNLPLPSTGLVQYRERPGLSQPIVVSGIARGLIATEGYLQAHIPLAAISYLELTACKSQTCESIPNRKDPDID